MLEPRTLTHYQLASIVADVQTILWQESRLLPEFPRELGEYWNPAKEDDSTTLEQIAEVLADADLKPPDFLPVDQSTQRAPTLLDASLLLWTARLLASRNASLTSRSPWPSLTVIPMCLLSIRVTNAGPHDEPTKRPRSGTKTPYA